MTWLYLPSACFPESACSTKVSEQDLSTWASAIAPFATLSGKLTQPQSWLRAWKKARWMRHLSGPTLPPSMQKHGVERWIASLPDSRARIFRSPGGAPGSTVVEADSSLRLSGSLRIAVREACFWRTSQASLLPPPPLWTKPKANSTSARPPESWENWPTAGGIRNGSLFQRPTWVPAMGAQGGSASRGGWLTPHGMSGMEVESGKAGAGGEFAKQATRWTTPTALERSGQGERNSALTLDVKCWQTPKASEMDRGVCPSEMNRNSPSLLAQSAHWATPKASDGTKGGPNQAGSKGDLMLPSMAAQWPTPNVPNGGRTLAQEYVESKGATPDGKRQVGLEMVAKYWPTPTATDSEQAGSVNAGHLTLYRATKDYSPPDPVILDGQESSTNSPSSPRHLNPLFGAWLMGWPSTWVIAEPHASSALETASWRRQLQSHLSYLLDEPGLDKEAA